MTFLQPNQIAFLLRFWRVLTVVAATADDFISCNMDVLEEPIYKSLVWIAVPTLIMMGTLLVMQLPDYVTVVVSSSLPPCTRSCPMTQNL